MLKRGKNKTNNYIEIRKTQQNFNFTPNNADFFNIRCRNFDKDSTEKILKLFGNEYTKYFVFTRHPASFFKSATKYHLRGNEKWCKNRKLEHFAGKTLYQSLHDSKNFGEQLVVSMKHFGIEQRFLNNWVENLAFLEDQGANYQQFHAALLYDGFYIDFEQVLGASPLREGGFTIKHATGEFREDVFKDYDDFAKDFYNLHFKGLETILRY